MPHLKNTSTSIRIIIAQDEAVLAKLLTRLILRYDPDASITTYQNGRDALVAYDRAGADLLISDYQMPHMTGPTLARILRARGDPIPIIGISSDAGNADAFRAAGATVFFEATAFQTALFPLIISLLVYS